MSDTEAKNASELFTRKSSRQKTPNTYYKQDISDIRGEPKPKQQKQPMLKVGKQQKKNQKNLQKSLHGLQQSASHIQGQQLLGKQGQMRDSEIQSKSYEREDESENEYDQKEDNLMEVESDAFSDAPEGSEQQDSPSLSQEESKKSYQNNANTSYTENEDNSNKTPGGYQTRKIRKKPKFADDNYIDNMPVSKSQQPKKMKPTTSGKSENTKKSQKSKKDGNQGGFINMNYNKDSSSQLQQNSEPIVVPSNNQQAVQPSAAIPASTASTTTKTAKSQKSQASQKKAEKAEKQGEDKNKETYNSEKAAAKEKKENSKKDKTDDILKGGLLDIFLDAIVQSKQDSNDELSPTENKGFNNNFNSAISNNSNSNNTTSNNNNNNINAQNQNTQQNNQKQNGGNISNQNDVNSSNQQNQNNQVGNAQQNNQNGAPSKNKNSTKGNKRNKEEEKQKLNQIEDQTTQKKKVKGSKKDKKEGGNSEGSSQIISTENIQNEQKTSKKIENRSVSNSIENQQNGVQKTNDNILKESNTQNQLSQSISFNGTIYNFPNINNKSDCITHVDKTKEKMVIHHSSFAPMEINRIFLKEDVRSKIDIQQLISQITMQQIQKQQQQQSQQTIQKFAQFIESYKKEQEKQVQSQINAASVPQAVGSLLQNLFSKPQNSTNNIQPQQITQKINSLAQMQQQNIFQQNDNNNLNNLLGLANNSNLMNNANDKQSIIQQLLLRSLGQNGTNLNNKNNQIGNGMNLYNNNNMNENQIRGQSILDTFNQAAQVLQTLNGNKNSNFMQEKSRSQSQEFEPSLVQRKLSEHFKINQKWDEDVQQNVKPPSRKSSSQNNQIVVGLKSNKEEQTNTKKETTEKRKNSYIQENKNNLIEEKFEKALTQLNQMNQLHTQLRKESNNNMDIEKQKTQENVQNDTDFSSTIDEQQKDLQVQKQVQENQINEEDSMEEEQEADETKNNTSIKKEEENIKPEQQQEQQQQQNIINEVKQVIQKKEEQELQEKQIESEEIDEKQNQNEEQFNDNNNENEEAKLNIQQTLFEMILNNFKPQIPDINNIKSDIKQDLANITNQTQQWNQDIKKDEGQEASQNN